MTREKQKKPRDLVLLKDLVPRKDPKGGAGKPVFGERVPPAPPGPDSSPRKPKKAR